MYMPIVGLGMKMMDFVFVSRNWERDKVKLARRVGRLAYRDFSFALAIFPEGTTLCNETYGAMKQHVEAKGIEKGQVPKRTLIPRVNGIHAVLNSLGEAYCDGVLDLTFGYEGVDFGREDPEVSFGIKKLLFDGIAPRKIHVHAKFYPLATLPITDRGQMSVWLKGRFLEKDRMLEGFASHGRFHNCKYQWGEADVAANSSRQLINATVATLASCILVYFFKLFAGWF
jgi:hypothetical protein